MHKKIIIPVIILVIIAIGGGLWWYLQAAETSATTSGVTASGFIESTDVSISPEISGRIISLSVNEGDQVKAGDVLVKLDDSTQKAQLKQATAALSVAQAFALQAQAAQNQAKLYVDGAKKAWENARDILQNPLEIDSQIAQAQSQLDLAELALEYQMDTTRLSNNALGAPAALPWTIAFAKQQRDGAKMVLNSLVNIKNNPQNLKASVDQLQAAYLTASAASEVADKAAQTHS